MARLKFQCQDRDGNLVEFETSEHEGKELMATYPQYVKWLTDNGFTLLKAKRGLKPKVRFDGKVCPVCKSPVYDNRTKKQSGEWKATAPDFTCSNKQCTGGTAKTARKSRGRCGQTSTRSYRPHSPKGGVENQAVNPFQCYN